MIADVLINLTTLNPTIAPLAAGVMADVLAIRRLEAMSAQIKRAEHDRQIAVIQSQIDDLKDKIADLEIERDFQRLEADDD